jgi:serine/threonine-protein phosphatase CPPED1
MNECFFAGRHGAPGSPEVNSFLPGLRSSCFMQTHQILSGLLAAATILVSSASQADDLPADTNGRFTQARSRTFRTFDTRTQQTWQGPYFFLQLADTQYGMFTGNKGFEKEVALSQQAVEHINRLRPRYVIVCGDLTNASPEHARYGAQVQQYKQDFSAIHDDIPLVCVCGNHDVGNRPTAKSIATYNHNFGDDYFGFWVGGVCNVVLNSSVLKDPTGAPEVLDAQQKWLDQQLAAAREAQAKHIFLFQHHPLFLTKEDEPDQYFNIPLVRRTPLLEQLKQADVRAVFAGHYHRNAYGRAGAMEMVTTGPVGRPLGKDPSGFRIVTVHETSIQHQYYGMDDVPEKINLTETPNAP